jgi:hypothetical protein
MRPIFVTAVAVAAVGALAAIGAANAKDVNAGVKIHQWPE